MNFCQSDVNKLKYSDHQKICMQLRTDKSTKCNRRKEELLKINSVREEIIQNIKIIIKEVTNWLKLLEVHKFIIPFSMVQSLMDRITKEKSFQNAILISDFNDLVSDIIKNEPAGFIFEKIGSRYKYVLIDELDS